METWLRGKAPMACSVTNIRDKTMVGFKSIGIICVELVASGEVEAIETTAGKMYRWKGGK